MTRHLLSASLLVLVLDPGAWADPPVASYIFPPGAQRGTAVDVRVGGLNLHSTCGFELLGPGVQVPSRLQRAKTAWFEGPLLPLPESQQVEDYPKDMAGRVTIADDAPPGFRYWRLWTAQGATPAMKFVVGDLAEIVEREIDGDPVPVNVQLPLTINGRIFPREDVDVWCFAARKGQTITGDVTAARLGSPLDSRVEVLDPQGRPVAENEDTVEADSRVRFTAPADGTYQVRIHDINFKGGQAYVYRLMLTADPWVDRVYPLGGRRGGKTRFEVSGQGLPAEPVEVALPAVGPVDYAHRLSVGGKQTNPFLLELDDLPEHLEAEPNEQPAQAKLVNGPVVLNGRIGQPGDIDGWLVAMKKGETREFELRASRLGSPLQGVLTVSDPAGKELARAEADTRVRFTAPAGGNYFVRVEERFRSRGGPAFAYRLRVAPPPGPDFRLQVAADAVSLIRGTPAKLRVNAERLGGFNGPITLAIDGLPAGVTAPGTTIAANQPGTEITFQAQAAAKITASRLTIRGSAKVGNHAVTRNAVLPAPRGHPKLDTVLLAVSLPTPFKVVGAYDLRPAARGTVYHRKYRIERGGFTGPLEIRLADRQARHLQGVTGPVLSVPPDRSEFDYPVFLPPWMELGRTSRSCVMAIGRVKDADGTEHEVSFTSQQQNEQIIAIMEPGRLAVEADRGSLLAEPGRTAVVAVRVSRDRTLQGTARLELIVAEHVRGVSAAPVEIPADKDRAALAIRFAGDLKGPFNVPLVVRATIMEKGEPVVAETKLALQPPK